MSGSFSLSNYNYQGVDSPILQGLLHTDQNLSQAKRGARALENYFAWLKFGISNGPKKNSTPHSLCCDFGGYKTFTTRRFRGQNQRPSSWGRSPALLVRVVLASTDTGRFRVGGSRCWPQVPRQAFLRKTCYHSCDTESVQEPIRF